MLPATMLGGLHDLSEVTVLDKCWVHHLPPSNQPTIPPSTEAAGPNQLTTWHGNGHDVAMTSCLA